MTPPANAELMADRIPDARLEVRPGVRHGYYLEDPGATAVVIDFLRRHPVEASG